MATHVFSRNSFPLALLALLLIGPVGCAPEADDGSSRDDANDQAIVSGKAATAYTEAVLVDLYSGGIPSALCSGALIAPKVVLTAGHCVHGWDGWSVEAPFASGQKASAESGATFDWKAVTEKVDPRMHDLGLVFLSTPIALAAYPTIATEHVPFGSKVQNIGRIHNGEPSFTELFVGKSIAVADGDNYGFPFAYASTDVIESGDSGGPVVKPGTHEIVAVNSGAGNGMQVLARTDQVASWIQQQIDAHGGSGAGAESPGQTGCGSLTFAGKCAGNSVEWCENGQPQKMTCADAGQTCKYDKTNKYYNCM